MSDSSNQVLGMAPHRCTVVYIEKLIYSLIYYHLYVSMYGIRPYR